MDNKEIKPEPIFLVLAEGGSLSISRIILNGQQRFLTRHQEHDFTNEGLGVNQQIGYGSFEEAFASINVYPWHLLHLHRMHEDYRITVLERLMEVLNREKGSGASYLQRKLQEHEQVLGATIYRDASGEWRYIVKDNEPFSSDKINTQR